MYAIKHYLLIKCPIEKVYESITTMQGLASWWTRQTIVNNKTIDFRFGDTDHVQVSVIKLIPNNYIEWECVIGDSEWIRTKFIFNLEKRENETVLRFSHSDWKKETDFFASCNYQWGYYLRSLKLYCESGKGTPFSIKNQ